MASKAMQDMTVRELLSAVVTTKVGSTNCNWCVVPTEEARQAHIEHMLEVGYECECDDGPRSCLEATTVVLEGTDEFIVPHEEDEAGLARMPVYVHISTGPLGVQMSEAVKLPLVMFSALLGLDAGAMDQSTLEERLAEASREVIDNVDDFLASFDGEVQ